MKATMVMDKPAAAPMTAVQRIRPVRKATRRGQPAGAQYADEQQVVEMERTFSVRWEW